jgi:hypothetical protein
MAPRANETYTSPSSADWPDFRRVYEHELKPLICYYSYYGITAQFQVLDSSWGVSTIYAIRG